MRRLQNWLHGERGVSEAATVIFVLPIIASMLFVLIESGFYMRSTTTLDGIVQDVVRGVAYDGGYDNPRTNSIGRSWVTELGNRLTSACSTGVLRCLGAPTYSCSPDVATASGQTVTCTASVGYKVVSPLSKSPMFSLGFSGLFTGRITSTVTSISSTGTYG